MRRFMVHLVTDVEFEDGDEASDKTVQNYQKQLSETVRNAAQGLATDTVAGSSGVRTIPFAGLHRLPGATPNVETALAPGDLITGFNVPAGPWTRRSLRDDQAETMQPDRGHGSPARLRGGSK
jgi:hypothetical protein